jgi:hypothetical protein
MAAVGSYYITQARQDNHAGGSALLVGAPKDHTPTAITDRRIAQHRLPLPAHGAAFDHRLLQKRERLLAPAA